MAKPVRDLLSSAAAATATYSLRHRHPSTRLRPLFKSDQLPPPLVACATRIEAPKPRPSQRRRRRS